MIAIDQLYGAIVVPEWLDPVVQSPELQRLREVRLINTSSTSCPGLSDVRRFTHTLGVLKLALRIESRILATLSSEEAKAFLVSALLHDIGTPAFGHLFEYQLAAIKGWDHERFVSQIIRGTYRPEKRNHQIYYYNALRLHEVLRQTGVDIELVASFVRGEQSLGKILAGSVDLDNIDGVFRMALNLGLQPDTKMPVQLMDKVRPNHARPIFEEDALEILTAWKDLRQKVYQFLAFDESCLSGQAMLTDCLTVALQEDLLSEEDWYLTDEALLRFLLEQEQTREIIKRFAIGDYYQQLFLGWYQCPRGKLDLRHPDNRRKLTEQINEATGLNCSPYVFYDSGTFSKGLELQIGTSSESSLLSFSKRSESTIVAVFTARRVTSSEQRRIGAEIRHVMEENSLPSSCLTDLPDRQNIHEFPGQRTLSF